MKKTFLILVISLFCLQTTIAQNTDTIKINTTSKVALIGKHSITSKTKIEEVENILGKPSRIEKVGGVDRHYIYDQLGLSFDGGKKGLVEALMVNYNYDNDKKAATGTYKGSLFIDQLLVSENTTVENIKLKANVKDLICLAPSLCMSDLKSPIIVVIGYNNKATITQITFGFSNQ